MYNIGLDTAIFDKYCYHLSFYESINYASSLSDRAYSLTKSLPSSALSQVRLPRDQAINTPARHSNTLT